MNRQVRRMELREVGDDGRNFTAMAVRYGVIDDYETRFLPGCFNDGLEKRLPKIAWGHDWSDIVGRVTSYEDTAEGLVIHARLSDPEAVPRARQAIAQLRDGDVDDVSVGFTPTSTQTTDGIFEFVKAELDEVSLVLRGAVPGAKVLALRSTQVIPAEIAGQIIAQLSQGTIDLLGALQAVKDSSVMPSADEPHPTEPSIVEHDPALPETGEPVTIEVSVETPEVPVEALQVPVAPTTADEELDQLLVEVDQVLAGVDH